ncbi:MAG: acyl carrier protein [Verrucomicrobia bacterium]|nr:acyl carrier protein [Verrucomicrobiota bacterium]
MTTASASPVSAVNLPDEAKLRESLKRCPPEAVDAACEFRRTGDLALLPVIVRGVVARFVDRVHRDRLNHPTAAELQLTTDLGLDSLTMMEIVMLAEDVFPITINNEELRGLRTVGDVQHFIECKLRGVPPPAPVVAEASRLSSAPCTLPT